MGEMILPAHGGQSKSPVVAVIGTGYIGFQLVTIFGQKYKTIAFDIREDRIKDIASLVGREPNIICSTDAAQLVNATHFLVAVPTGLSYGGKEVDISPLHAALDTVGRYAQREATVVIESSVAVGMTRKLLGPLLVTKALKGGMSPERVDPGRTDPPSQGIPKVISGLDDISPGSLASIESLYSSIFANLVNVSTPEVAEMTKLYENCQRMVCIAYANEMADACAVHNIDPFEVSSAAATKPFGYCPIVPGIGAGGSCIPINPYYLFLNGKFPLLKAATENTWNRPRVIADQIMDSYWESRPERNGFSRLNPSILVVGVAFKPGQSSITFSPGVALIQHIMTHWKANVTFADPLVQSIPVPNVTRLDESKEWHKQRLEQFDMIIVAMKQDNLDCALLGDLEGVRLIMCCA
ncbi:uncharacterized protein N7446_004944 [Penicillium canescens]|uniref:Nucleotide sugar dehydrogenase n=1 Tax=Penicillium canescens TaxID=5083 RepID=A0AAD6N2X1_PENCN|nr:uncharacterized protein N7446_004944 [Penicillium canescens]KAJ6026457.1 hypothetical protein N7460_011274 [Penicillium canescens]KAJ6039740.1 hypothetical protein N7444_008645 [Penicillium canescens]KAJ6067907.1 hypothetical protein N7446_004944 [Penicillium canescens]